MRHAEIAKAPSELGKDADKAQRLAVIIKRIKETNAQESSAAFASPGRQHSECDHGHHHQEMSIIKPCTKSVQHTARKPPKNV